MTQTINDFVMKNLIYCEDTHSFVHRLYDKLKAGKTKMGHPITSYRDAQQVAWDVVQEMNLVEETK